MHSKSYNDYSLIFKEIDVITNKKHRTQGNSCVDTHSPIKAVGDRRTRRWLYY
jgi:hypothetical protein